MSGRGKKTTGRGSARKSQKKDLTPSGVVTRGKAKGSNPATPVQNDLSDNDDNSTPGSERKRKDHKDTYGDSSQTENFNENSSKHGKKDSPSNQSKQKGEIEDDNGLTVHSEIENDDLSDQESECSDNFSDNFSDQDESASSSSDSSSSMDSSSEEVTLLLRHRRKAIAQKWKGNKKVLSTKKDQKASLRKIKALLIRSGAE